MQTHLILSTSSFVSVFPIFANSIEEMKTDKKYLYWEGKNRLFHVIKGSKKAIKGLVPLNLRNLIALAKQNKKEIEKDKETIGFAVSTLQMMSQRRKDNDRKSCIFLRLIRCICDYIRNGMIGIGFNSSQALALKYSKEFETIYNCIKCKEKSSTGEQTNEVEKNESKQTHEANEKGKSKQNDHKETLVNNERDKDKDEKIQEKIFLEEKKEPLVLLPIPEKKIKRLRELLEYLTKRIEDDTTSKLANITISVLFHDLTLDKKENLNDPLTSFVGLMRSVCEYDQYRNEQGRMCVNVSNNVTFDLTTPKALYTLDVIIQYCKGNFLDSLPKWLSDNNLLNGEIIKICLESYQRRQESLQIGFITDILKFYQNQEYAKRELSANDLAIVNAMTLQLSLAHNENTTTLLLKWYSQLPEFNFSICVAMIEGYIRRGRSLKTACPNRDLIKDKFVKNAEWRERLKIEHTDVYDTLFPEKNQQNDLEKKEESKDNSVSTKEGQEAAKRASLILKRKGSSIIKHMQNEQQTNEKSAIVPKRKKDKIEKYIKHVKEGLNEKLDNKLIGVIFNDLNMDPNFSDACDSTNSISGLMQIVSGHYVMDIQDDFDKQKYVDLEDMVSLKVLSDIITYAPFRNIDKLSDWLVMNPSFGMLTIKTCLTAGVQRLKNNSSGAPFLSDILKKYSQNYVKGQSDGILAPTDSIVEEARDAVSKIAF